MAHFKSNLVAVLTLKMTIDQATLAKPFLARWNGVIPLGNTQALTWSSSHGFDDAHLNSGFVPYYQSGKVQDTRLK